MTVKIINKLTLLNGLEVGNTERSDKFAREVREIKKQGCSNMPLSNDTRNVVMEMRLSIELSYIRVFVHSSNIQRSVK